VTNLPPPPLPLVLQLGTPTVQLSTFPPPPLRSDVVAQDAGGGAGAITAGADGAFRVLTNPSTGFELKANLVSLRRTASQAFEPFFSPFFSFLSWFYHWSYFEPFNRLVYRGFSCPRSHRRDLCRATDAGAAARAQRREGERPARLLSGQRLVEQHMCSISSISISISSSSSTYHRDCHRPSAILSCVHFTVTISVAQCSMQI
jgi:hypothetical protein